MNYILTVINPESQDLLTTIYNQLGLTITTIAHGEGTADDSIRDLFGIDYPKDKRIVAAIASPEKTQQLLKAQKRYLDIDAPGHGMTAVIPVKSVGGRSVLSWLLGSSASAPSQDTGRKKERDPSPEAFSGNESFSSKRMTERKESDMQDNSQREDSNHELILCIANNGATDDVMAAARKAGAHGGTVIHGKGTGDRNTPRFYNVTISSEKEIILILSRAEIRSSIMQTILQEAGPSTPAGAIVFSLPVTAVAGIDE